MSLCLCGESPIWETEPIDPPPGFWYTRTMNELLQPLYALHLLDDRIHHARQGIAALDAPPPLAAQQQRIRAELAKQEPALRKARGDLLDAELQLRSLEERREGDRKKLYGGKIVGTRELQALEHEIETLGASIGACEERVLAAMEKVEPLQAAVEKLHHYDKTAEEKLAALRQSQEKDRKRLLADIARDEPLRAEAVKTVDPALLRTYETIRQKRGHPGLAVIEGNACGSCHTSIPTMVLRELREGKKIIQCDNCTRIYYMSETG